MDRMGSDHDLEQWFQEASEKYEVDCALLESVGMVESGWQQHAINEVGCRGIMQMGDAALLDIGFEGDIWDPRDNILAGAAYLARIRDHYLRDFGLVGTRQVFWVVAAYNWGPGHAMEHLTHGKRPLELPVKVFVYVGRVLGEYMRRFKTDDQPLGCSGANV